MTRLEELEAAIDSLPEDFIDVKCRLKALVSVMDWRSALVYACGVDDTLDMFTSDETYLKPMRKIVEILR